MANEVRRDASPFHQETYIELGPFKVRLIVDDELPASSRNIVISSGNDKYGRVNFCAVTDGKLVHGYVDDNGKAVITSSEEWVKDQ